MKFFNFLSLIFNSVFRFRFRDSFPDSVSGFRIPDSGFRIPCFSAAVFVGFVERKESRINNPECGIRNPFKFHLLEQYCTVL